jgi:hypothetical protein
MFAWRASGSGLHDLSRIRNQSELKPRSLTI